MYNIYTYIYTYTYIYIYIYNECILDCGRHRSRRSPTLNGGRISIYIITSDVEFAHSSHTSANKNGVEIDVNPAR